MAAPLNFLTSLFILGGIVVPEVIFRQQGSKEKKPEVDPKSLCDIPHQFRTKPI